MNVLITNDDGIYSKGIRALCKAVRTVADRVTVVAPESQQSAKASAITLYEPLRVKEVTLDGYTGYAVFGTPVDCVKIALLGLMDHRPDVVISGINHGPNTGTNILYSGTVAAAAEGCTKGIPAAAVSLSTYEEPDFSYAAGFTLKILDFLAAGTMPVKTFLNVNIPYLPPSAIQGTAVTRQGGVFIDEYMDKRTDPHGNDYYWLCGDVVENGDPADTDTIAVAKGYISVTPLRWDMTDDVFLNQLKDNLSL